MKNALIAVLALTAGSLSIAGTAAAQQDCSGFSERASFYSSVGLTDSATFWNSIATACTDNNWAEADRSTVRSGIQTLATDSSYERPEREAVQAAAEAAGVELPSRPQRGGKGGGKGPKGGGNR